MSGSALRTCLATTSFCRQVSSPSSRRRCGRRRRRRHRPARSLTNHPPAEHSRRVGDRLFAYIIETFRDDRISPSAIRGDPVKLETGANQLMAYFVISGYAVGYELATDPLAGTMRVKLRAPATLWSQEMLTRLPGRTPIANSFETKVMLAFLRRCGAAGATLTGTRIDGTTAIHDFALGPLAYDGTAEEALLRDAAAAAEAAKKAEL